MRLACPAATIDAVASGASTVSVAVVPGGTLGLSLSGASTAYYQGSAVLNVRECSGASSYHQLQ